MTRKLTMIAVAASLAFSGTALAKGKKADAGGGAKLKFDVAPPETEIIVDGQKKGTAEKVKELNLSPGTHQLDFKFKGDEHTDQVTLKKGQSTTFAWKFEDDRHPAMSDDNGGANDQGGDQGQPAGNDPQQPAPEPSGDMK